MLTPIPAQRKENPVTIRRTTRRRGRPRLLLGQLAVLLCTALAITSANPAAAGPAPALAPAPDGGKGVTAIRNAMTWAVVGQQGGAVHFGSDAQTNVYSGDTPIDQYRPALCLLVDDQAAPGGITFDFYSGWARGAVKATAPVRGDALSSQAAADALCAQSFGPGWRLAEFHDGRYGPGFSQSGGWSFWAAAGGPLMPGTRYWVAISDQPANAWNSTGDLPAPIEVQPDDVLIKTRLQETMQPLLTFSRQPAFRNLVNTGVARQFDGDTNVLLGDVIRDAEAAGIVNPTAPAWLAIKAADAQLRAMPDNNEAQIYIPNYGDGAAADADVTMVLTESDVNVRAVPGYRVDAAGNLVASPTLIDEDYSEAHEVWVLSINEGPQDGVTAAASKAAAAELDTQIQGGDARIMGACTVYGLRMNRGEEYLNRIMLPDLGEVTSWLDGKVELRLAIIGKGGVTVINHEFPKIKRKKLKHQAWLDMDHRISTWDRDELGYYWAYQWFEVSKGPHISGFSLNFSAAWKQKLEISAGFTVQISLEKRHKDIGASLVGFRESTTTEYTTGKINWYGCSLGGVEENLAILATASASSTYPFEPYSPNHVNDGSRSTAMSPLESWSNADRFAPGGLLPQWVQLDFGAPMTFNTVVVYTSQGFAIQNYQIEILNAAGLWQRISVRTGNTSLMWVHQLAFDYTARFVRILGTRGPNVQPQHVRVNEFEVYRR